MNLTLNENFIKQPAIRVPRKYENQRPIKTTSRPDHELTLVHIGGGQNNWQPSAVTIAAQVE